MNNRSLPIRLLLVGVSVGALALALAQGGGSSNQQTQTSQTKSGNASSSASASATSNGWGNGSGSGSGFAATPNYAAVFVPGPRFDALTGEARETLLQQQLAYHAKLAKNLKVLHFGPWRDHPGGLATLLARSDAEAQSLVDGDPTVQAGLYAAEVRAWNVLVTAGPSRSGG